MILQDLLQGLRAEDAVTRGQSALVIGLVQEVEAREALIERYQRETQSKVKWAINWAGERVQAARANGFSTLEAILHYFQIDAEMRQHESADQEALRKLRYEMEMNALRAKEREASRDALGRMAKASMFGLPGLLLLGAGNKTANFADMDPLKQLGSSNIRRIRPTPPSDEDISRYVERLFKDPSPSERAQAASDLVRLVNNPQALPHLARSFTQDESPQVKEAAEQAGKLLYWNATYWQMEQDGSMQAEIARRYGAGESAAKTDASADQASAEDIAAMLRQAEAKREKRKRR